VADFLKQLYLTSQILKQINDASAGTTVGTYTISSAKKTIIPVPTLAEQSAIAEVLNNISFINSLKIVWTHKLPANGSLYP
jgi:type I restriction enzyme S subunit